MMLKNDVLFGLKTIFFEWKQEYSALGNSFSTIDKSAHASVSIHWYSTSWANVLYPKIKSIYCQYIAEWQTESL